VKARRQRIWLAKKAACCDRGLSRSDIRLRKLRLGAACLVCLPAIVFAPSALTALGSQGFALNRQGSAQQLMELLDARSPGERQQGELSQIKRRRAAGSYSRGTAPREADPLALTPVERLSRAVVPTPEAALVYPTVPLTPSLSSATLTIGQDTAPIGSVAAAPGAIRPSIIGGGFAPPPGTSVPTLSAAVSSAVPEPGSWLMMLLGFGAIGASIRHRRKPCPSRRQRDFSPCEDLPGEARLSLHSAAAPAA
jgi:hypothetical protein